MGRFPYHRCRQLGTHVGLSSPAVLVALVLVGALVASVARRRGRGLPLEWPPWAAAKYRTWCPVQGDVSFFVDRKGRPPAPPE